jgi:hypothetical protein
VHEVLSDKQPIIEELTARLRAVAEGEGGADTGLGLRIVTVQIKEAVVSSSRLWENLQKPFRSDQARLARLAELAAEGAISEREMVEARERQTRQMDNDRELSEQRARNDAAAFDRETQERVRRAERDETDARTLADLSNETSLHALRLERDRREEETEIARLRVEAEQLLARLGVDGELALARARAGAAHETALLALERAKIQASIDNDQSPATIQARLIDSLPDIVSRLPKPDELRAVTIGGADSTTVSGLLTELAAVVGALRAAVTPAKRGKD